MIKKLADSAAAKAKNIRKKIERTAEAEGIDIGAGAGAKQQKKKGAGDGRPALERVPSLRLSLIRSKRASAEGYLFDYNKIDGGFLFCNGVVMLSGIMFASGFYEEGTSEHATLTWFAVAIIGGCTALIASILMGEMVRRTSPPLPFLSRVC